MDLVSSFGSHGRFLLEGMVVFGTHWSMIDINSISKFCQATSMSFAMRDSQSTVLIVRSQFRSPHGHFSK